MQTRTSDFFHPHIKKNVLAHFVASQKTVCEAGRKLENETKIAKSQDVLQGCLATSKEQSCSWPKPNRGAIWETIFN